jgi:hypothetical protein
MLFPLLAFQKLIKKVNALGLNDASVEIQDVVAM